MRWSVAFLCFSVLFSSSEAAAPADPAAAYLAARDRDIADLKSHPAVDASDTRMETALADLERQLTSFVPPWKAQGFSARGKISLDTLSKEDLGFGRLDGLVYEGKDSEVLVTTPSLLRHWMADHNGWWEGSDNIPQPFAAGLRSEQFWTYAMFDDARAVLYGELPVAAPKAGVQVVAQLAAFAQDLVFDAGPTDVLIAVIYPDRAFVARQKLTVSTRAVPVCRDALVAQRARSEAAYKAYQASNLRDQKMFDKHVQIEEKADRDYRTCFAARLHDQPQYDAVVRQTQAFVELLR